MSQYVSFEECNKLICMLDEYSSFLAKKRISSAIDQLMALPRVKSTQCEALLQQIKKQVVDQTSIQITDPVSNDAKSPWYKWSVRSADDSKQAMLMNTLREKKECVGAVEKLERNLRRWYAARDFKHQIIPTFNKATKQIISNSSLCSDKSFQAASRQFINLVGADTHCADIFKQIRIVLREMWHGVSTAARSLVGKKTRFFDTVAHRKISECVSDIERGPVAGC